MALTLLGGEFDVDDNVIECDLCSGKLDLLAIDLLRPRLLSRRYPLATLMWQIKFPRGGFHFLGGMGSPAFTIVGPVVAGSLNRSSTDHGRRMAMQWHSR